MTFPHADAFSLSASLFLSLSTFSINSRILAIGLFDWFLYVYTYKHTHLYASYVYVYTHRYLYIHVHVLAMGLFDPFLCVSCILVHVTHEICSATVCCSVLQCVVAISTSTHTYTPSAEPVNSVLKYVAMPIICILYRQRFAVCCNAVHYVCIFVQVQYDVLQCVAVWYIAVCWQCDAEFVWFMQYTCRFACVIRYFARESVAACFSVFQCVAVCSSVLCLLVSHVSLLVRALQRASLRCSVLQRVAVCCRMLQYAAVLCVCSCYMYFCSWERCSVLQRVAVCSIVL